MEALPINNKNATLDPIQQSILNKKASLPPNKIITKEYSPDVKPLVKLMYLSLHAGQNNNYKIAQKTSTIFPPKSKTPISKNTHKISILLIFSDSTMQKNSTKWFTSDTTIHNLINGVRTEPKREPNFLLAFSFPIKPSSPNNSKLKIISTLP